MQGIQTIIELVDPRIERIDRALQRYEARRLKTRKYKSATITARRERKQRMNQGKPSRENFDQGAIPNLGRVALQTASFHERTKN